MRDNTQKLKNDIKRLEEQLAYYEWQQESTEKLLHKVRYKISQMLPWNKKIKVLDMGCGKGNLVNMLLKQGYENVVGIDIEEEQSIKYCKMMYPKAKFKVVDANGILPFPDNYFDVVVAMGLLEHVHSPYHTLKEMARVSKKKVIVSVPNQFFTEISQKITGLYCIGLGLTELTLRNLAKMLDINITKWEYYYGSLSIIRRILPQYLSTGFIVEIRGEKK